MTEPTHAANPPTVRFRSWQAWRVAIRPQSLPAALSPVLVGAAMGYLRTGTVDAAAALPVLLAALLMQVVTNLQNDVGFTVRSAGNRPPHTGLPRATVHGWLRPRDVRIAIGLAALLAAGLGALLLVMKGWPVVAIGTASLLAALAYMGGPRPIAYTPFGELAVFVFFGLVAVIGTDWVLTGGSGVESVLAAAAIGALAAAALAVNNHRDIAHDREVGRHTFAVVCGEPASRALYAALLGGPFVLLAGLAVVAGSGWLLLPVVLAVRAARLWQAFARRPQGTGFNPVLFGTFRLELAFAVLLALGAVLARIGRIDQ